MKIKFILPTASVIIAGALLLARWPARPGDPKVTAVVGQLPRPGLSDGARAEARPASRPAQPPASPVPAGNTVSVAPASVRANALSLSSFFASNEVAGLSDEQLAQLELTLIAARKAAFALIVDRARVTAAQNGGLKITLTGQGEALAELKEYVMESIRAIVGPDYMKSLQHSLGTKFEHHFAYFGKYDTVIDLSIEERTNAPSLVTMTTSFEGLPLGLFRGNISSTSVLYADRFEVEYFSPGSLRPVR